MPRSRTHLLFLGADRLAFAVFLTMQTANLRWMATSAWTLVAARGSVTRTDLNPQRVAGLRKAVEWTR